MYGKINLPSVKDLCDAWKFAWAQNCQEGVNDIVSAMRSGLVFHDCTVPGNFELDLQKLGELPQELFFGMNPVEAARKTERCHVYYARRFAAEQMPGTRAVLVFKGIDCFADVFVNGKPAAKLDNMLIEHEIDVTDLLASGENELFIHIRPALLEALKYEYPQLVNNQATNHESLYVRKAPHMYGWDIMPRFLSAGMYRPVTIEYRPEERIEELYLKTVSLDADFRLARLLLFYKLSCRLDGRYTVKIHMDCNGTSVQAEGPVHFIAEQLVFDVPDPLLWQPKGRGEACLYDVRVELAKDGKVIDTREFRHGIRTVELLRTKPSSTDGAEEFVFIVNGEKVFIKGTNWVPMDAFHSRDRERIPAAMELVDDLNCNMIRCWGGNVYEDDLLYDLCDRRGILVWQDFAMACGVYPQDTEFAGRIAEEAALVIKRLRSHPSVAVWAGDNECDLAYRWAYSNTDPNTNILTRKILPEAVRQHDGTRPYICSSPYISSANFGKDDRYLPETHLWGPRDYYKSEFYTASQCRFASEIGYHGCPSPKSIRKFISPKKLWPYQDNEEWILHATSPVPGYHKYDYRIAIMGKQVNEMFTRMPDNLNDFAFASQVVQAEANKFLIELFRMGKWRRTGLLWWNIIDGWPQFSDAIVDYYYAKKLAWYFIRNCQQDVCVMLQEPGSWIQQVIVCNDTLQDKRIQIRIQDVDSGETVFESDAIAAANRSTAVGEIPYARNRQRFLVISWNGDAEGVNHYLAGQPPFDIGRYRKWLESSAMFGEALRDWEARNDDC